MTSRTVVPVVYGAKGVILATASPALVTVQRHYGSASAARMAVFFCASVSAVVTVTHRERPA